jgi:hypothetical protein
MSDIAEKSLIVSQITLQVASLSGMHLTIVGCVSLTFVSMECLPLMANIYCNGHAIVDYP